MAKPKHPPRINPNECQMCGAPIILQSGMKRCPASNCGHINFVEPAFTKHRERETTSKFPEYTPLIPKSVDKEMK